MKTLYTFLIITFTYSTLYAQNQFDRLDSLIENYNKKYSIEILKFYRLDVVKYFGIAEDSLNYINKDEQRTDVRGIVYESALNFAGEFSLATAIASVVQNMEILNEDEAHKINSLTDKGEKAINATANVVSALSGAASIAMMISKKDFSNAAQFSINIGAVAPQLLKSLSKKVKENPKLDSALTYAHEKASRLSVHAYLSLEMRSISETLKKIKEQAIVIKDNAQNVPDDELEKLCKDYITLVESIDNFYTFDLEKLKGSITERADYTVYAETVQQQLDNLALDIEVTIDLWKERRFNYNNSLEPLKVYISE